MVERTPPENFSQKTFFQFFVEGVVMSAWKHMTFFLRSYYCQENIQKNYWAGTACHCAQYGLCRLTLWEGRVQWLKTSLSRTRKLRPHYKKVAIEQSQTSIAALFLQTRLSTLSTQILQELYWSKNILLFHYLILHGPPTCHLIFQAWVLQIPIAISPEHFFPRICFQNSLHRQTTSVWFKPWPFRNIVHFEMKDLLV